MKKYKFNPIDYGFESVDNYPELSYNFPMGTGKWFIKVANYINKTNLIYWYYAIYIGGGVESDDRVEIMLGMHHGGRPLTHEAQHGGNTKYEGVISSDKFAKMLLSHIFATKNSEVETLGKKRLSESLGKEMRKKYYK